MTDANKTWIERFPRPEGERPPNPGKKPAHPGVEYKNPAVRDEYIRVEQKWRVDVKAHNDWGFANRRSIVAAALDDLQKRYKELTLVEHAVYVLGLAYLEGTLNVDAPGDIFQSLFGGIL